MRRLTPFLSFSAAVMLFFSCGEGNKQAPQVAVTSISLSQTALTLIEGESSTLSATVIPSDATDKNVTWASSNAHVATVTSGKVTALSAGTTTITASCSGKNATCVVTVEKKVIPVTSVALSKSSLSLVEGESSTLTATVSPSDATDQTVTWTSSNTAVATVDGGKVTAVKEGTATITASCGGKSATCAVTVEKKVIPVSSVTLSKSSLSLVEGESSTLTATVSPSDATDQTVTWTSSNTAVAKVDGGKVTAVKEGTATITASCGGKSATCTVTVKKKVIPVSSVALNKSALFLLVGESSTLTAEVYPANATDKTVTWSSSNPSVATVSGGKVTAVKAGTATITAKSGEKSATCAVTVSKDMSGGLEGTGDVNWD